MREHGTRACYVFGPDPGRGRGCRCEPCRKANRDYVARVERQRIYGRWQPWASDELVSEVREHLRALSAAGVGKVAVAEASGLPRSQVGRIRRGKIAKVREATARKLLAVTTSAGRRPHAIVDGAETWRLIEELLEAGWRRYQIAHELGAKTPALQLRRERVLWRHELAVRALHDREWDRDPRLREACHCYAAITFEQRRAANAAATRRRRSLEAVQ